MAQSAELMNELPTVTDRITALEGYDAMRSDTLQIVDALRQIVFRRGQARCQTRPDRPEPSTGACAGPPIDYDAASCGALFFLAAVPRDDAIPFG
jgi:hypothetical protein